MQRNRFETSSAIALNLGLSIILSSCSFNSHKSSYDVAKTFQFSAVGTKALWGQKTSFLLTIRQNVRQVQFKAFAIVT